MRVLEILASVSAYLVDRGVDHALIGAGAMSVVGYARSTQDLDLLTTNESVLARRFWSAFDVADVDVEIRDGRGDPTDPLAGLVRFEDPDGDQVDIVVGRHPRWQEPILTRAVPRELGEGLSIPVALPADLVLLKLFAGSRRDDYDILELLDRVDGLRDEVDQLVQALPGAERRRWERLREE